MNGVHDLGGMQGFGPVRPEANEPVFHAPWEGRMFAIGMAMIGLGLGGPPAWMEQLSPADYFSMSYYQKWYSGLVERALRARLITAEELATGTAAPGLPKAAPRLPAASVAERIARGIPGRLDIVVATRFAIGQTVRARNINPETRTRLPRYARGKRGVIERDHGVFNITDTQLVRREPQHVYSVRFAARELWGEQAKPKDTVYIDMWDDYLEPA